MRVEQSGIMDPNNKIELVSGVCACKGTAVGIVRIVTDETISKVNDKEFILVCERTNPAYLVLLMKAKAVVTATGGIVSHAAIVSRELGIPCIVGAEGAANKLKDGQLVFVDASKGVVYAGP